MRLIIDSKSIAYRVWYGFPRETPASPYIGFGNALLTLVNKFNPAELHICFDHPVSIKKEWGVGYKANRTPNFELDNFYESLYNKLNEFPLALYKYAGYEADDIIAGLTKGSPYKNVIVTADRDMLVLVNELTYVYFSPSKGRAKLYNLAQIMTEYELTPAQMLVKKILGGDVSDNIKGVKGIGAVYAKHFAGSVKDIYELERKVEKGIITLSRKQPKEVSLQQIKTATALVNFLEIDRFEEKLGVFSINDIYNFIKYIKDINDST